MPFSPIIVSYLFGSLSINSAQFDSSATLWISSFEAFSLEYLMLFNIVSSKSVVSWLTKEIFSLRDLIVVF